MFSIRFLLKRLFQYQAATEAGVLQPLGMMTYEQHTSVTPTELPAPIPKNTKTKVKKKVLKTKEEKGNISKTKSALHKKLTQAKLTAQAKNMAKLQYQRTPAKTPSKSPAQSKPPEKELLTDDVQQSRAPSQANEGNFCQHACNDGDYFRIVHEAFYN